MEDMLCVGVSVRAFMKHHDYYNFGRKEFIWLTTFKSTAKGSWGRNLEAETNAEEC